MADASRLSVKTNSVVGVQQSNERGQAVAEYAGMLAMLLGLLGVITTLGLYAHKMFAWVVAAVLH